MIAKNTNEMLAVMAKGIQKTLNSEAGQKLASELLEMKLNDNPNMTAEEWNETKAQFMVYMFHECVKNDKSLMNELGHHLYKELNA